MKLVNLAVSLFKKKPLHVQKTFDNIYAVNIMRE